MDVEDMGRQTRGTNKREEDNKAKQWGHRSCEMDGRRERQRQKKKKREGGVWEAEGLRGGRKDSKKMERERLEKHICGIKSLKK